MKTILLTFLTLITIYSTGQSIKQYSGKIGAGSGQYSYYENTDEERIKHGSFEYVEERFRGLSLKYTEKLNFIVKGNYKNGIKDGLWSETYIEYLGGYTGAVTKWDAIQQRHVIVDYLINDNNNIDAITKVRCNYLNGKLNGEYICEKYKLIDGKRVLVSSITAAFKEGVLTGKYASTEGKNKLLGEFDELGFLNGKWTETSTTELITSYFEHGYLKGYSKRSMPENIVVAKYDNLKVGVMDKVSSLGFTIDTAINGNVKEYENNQYDVSIANYPFERIELPIALNAPNKTEYLKIENEYKFKEVIAVFTKETDNEFEGYLATIIQNERKSKADSSIYYTTEINNLKEYSYSVNGKIRSYNDMSYNAKYDPRYTKAAKQALNDSLLSYQQIKIPLDETISQKESYLETYKQKQSVIKSSNDNQSINLRQSLFLTSWGYSDTINSIKMSISKVALENMRSIVLSGAIEVNGKNYTFSQDVDKESLINKTFNIFNENIEKNDADIEFEIVVFEKIISMKIRNKNREKDVILIRES